MSAAWTAADRAMLDRAATDLGMLSVLCALGGLDGDDPPSVTHDVTARLRALADRLDGVSVVDGERWVWGGEKGAGT